MNLNAILELVLKTQGAVLKDFQHAVPANALLIEPPLSIEIYPHLHRQSTRGIHSEKGKPVYETLQWIVDALVLPIEIEHALWSYPAYRIFAEGSTPYMTDFMPEEADALAHELEAYGNAWALQVLSAHRDSETLQNQARSHWTRFRNAVSVRIGRSPFSIVR